VVNWEDSLRCKHDSDLKGVRCSKALQNFSAPKSHLYKHKPLILQGCHLNMCLRSGNCNLWQSFMLRNAFVYKLQCELSCPKSARKLSVLLGNPRQTREVQYVCAITKGGTVLKKSRNAISRLNRSQGQHRNLIITRLYIYYLLKEHFNFLPAKI